jgi:hypothetical protein
MAQPTIQTSFGSGEWAPKLRSRVDIQKYKSGAALLRNFYVDYSGGGASTRQGTKFIAQCKTSGARLIPFQPSSTLSYVLEFGQNYIRFYSNGAAVLEAPFFAAGGGAAGDLFDLTADPPWVPGDWVYATGWGGLTNVNGNYFQVSVVFGPAVTVVDLQGNPVTFTGTWTSGGQLQRVYTITSPYLASDLFPNPLTGNPGLKFVQNVTSLIICHPNYPAQVLTETAATNWTINSIQFGPTIATPTGVAMSAFGTGSGWFYAACVTAVDANGQESAASAIATVSNTGELAAGSVNLELTWNVVPGASSYNVYFTSPSANIPVPNGSPFGFVGNCTGTSFNNSPPGIPPDFSQSIPIEENPFLGSPVTSLTITNGGSYGPGAAPTLTIAAPLAGAQATAYPIFQLLTSSVNAAGNGYAVNDFVNFNLVGVIQITGVGGGGSVSTYTVVHAFQFPFTGLFGTLSQASTSGTGTGLVLNVTFAIVAAGMISGGSGYTTVPAVAFSAGAAAATAVLGMVSSGNPGVPGFIQERLMFAGQPQAIQSYNMSQPGAFYNFNISNPSEDDDAIAGTIIAEELNDIRNLTPVPTGIIAFTGKGAWLINGGGGISTQTPITPSDQTAQPQGFNGANDLRPIKINMDVLYGTNKGNYVRDLTYNLYAQIFTGSDISVFSNHLFFGYYMLDWAWSEEPFKTLWAVRNDGEMLSLGYVKEQELIGWAHHDTNGQFKSVASVIENVNGNIVDAVYVIVFRQTYLPNVQLDNTWDIVETVNLTLTNAAHTATLTAPATGFTIATAFYRSGQIYAEFAVSSDYDQPGDEISVIDLSASTAVVISAGNGEVFVGSTGHPVLQFSLGNFNGQILRVALDATNALVWMAVAGGPWNGNPAANPNTGVGGINFPTTAGPSGPNSNMDEIYFATLITEPVLPSVTMNTFGPFTYTNPFATLGPQVGYVERMADRYFPYGYEDAWSVDCGLQTLPVFAGSPGVLSQNNGFNGVTLTVDSASGPALFTFSTNIGLNSGNVGDVIRTGGGIATIGIVSSGSVCACTITQNITAVNPYTGVPIPNTTDWTLWMPTTTVTGLTQLAGQSVVGLADGVPVGPSAVSGTGLVTLGAPASKVTLGLAYLPQLQTLPLDLGEPTVQGKRKKITGITLRVADTLGLSIGKTFQTLTAMKDFVLGNVPTTSNGPAKVTGLVSGDGRTIIDQAWDEAGNYCIQQNLPYPATVLGAMPEIAMGDTK